MSLIGNHDAMPEDADVRQKQSAPETCVARENLVFRVRAANAAGMKCIAVASGYYSVGEPDGEKPDTSLGEKEKILAYIPGPDASVVGS
jgi:beta-phosphoglucomutase-like phosphatase (HAD superfamily)